MVEVVVFTTNRNMNSVIEIRHLELVRLRIGYINNCNYSINLHLNELKNFGETDLRLTLVSVWSFVPYFSEKERALFALTDYILCSNKSRNYEKVNMLLKPHFSNKQILVLTQAIEKIDIWTRSLKHTESLNSFKKNSI